MIKKLFFGAALLAYLAHGADRSANLSVEAVPSGSKPQLPTSSVPPAAAAAGFATLALDTNYANYSVGDYTHVLDFQPQANANDSCGGATPQHSASGISWWQGDYVASTITVGCRHINIIYDPVPGQNVLDLTVTCDKLTYQTNGYPYNYTCPNANADTLQQGSVVLETQTGRYYTQGKDGAILTNQGYYEIEYAVVNPSRAGGVWTNGYMWQTQAVPDGGQAPWGTFMNSQWVGSVVNNTLTVTSLNKGFIWAPTTGVPSLQAGGTYVYDAAHTSTPVGFIGNQLSGTPGGVGTYYFGFNLGLGITSLSSETMYGRYGNVIEFDANETHSETSQLNGGGYLAWFQGGGGSVPCQPGAPSIFSQSGSYCVAFGTFPDANSTIPVYHKYGVLIQNLSAYYNVCTYLDNQKVACGTVTPPVMDQLNFWMTTIARGCAYSLGNSTCQNNPITSVYACPDGSGQACVKSTISMDYQEKDYVTHVSIGGQTGCPALNGYWPSKFLDKAPTTPQHMNIELQGTTYSSSCNVSGMINPFDHADMLVKSVRIWSDGFAYLLNNGVVTRATKTLN